MEQHGHVGAIDWQPIAPDKRHTWLTAGMHDEFETFLPMVIRSEDQGLYDNQSFFLNFSNGIQTNRDTWVYNFQQNTLGETVNRLIQTYNAEVDRWHNRTDQSESIDSFVLSDETKIKWSSRLKECLQRGQKTEFTKQKIRSAMYRPYCRQNLYFDDILNHRQGRLPIVLPTETAEYDNQLIWLKTGSEWPMFALITNKLPDQLPQGGSQCFPFYTYAEDGGNRRENITDWALDQFRAHYAAVGQSKTQNPKSKIQKWDIFHYVYALLHHPDYRTKYAANLRRELPRLPFVEDFWGFVQAGARLAELHVHYEQQPEYRLDFVETPDKPLDWRVERMKLNKDKTSLIYNDFLTLTGIPPQVYNYKLGNRSALEWVIDQYQVSIDKRSAIVNDPNHPDDPQSIVRLIGQVITVSLETVALVNNLPPLAIQPAR